MTRTTRGRVRAALILTLGAGGAACGDAAVSPPDPPDPPKAARLELVTDSAALWGYPGSATVERLVVVANDRAGNPVSGVLVSFSATDGGSATPSQATTGTDGRATTTWVLGTEPGAYRMTVQAEGVSPLVVVASTRLLVELEGDTVAVASPDTSFTLPVNVPSGQAWAGRVVEESRSLDDVPVVEVRRLQDPLRLELRVRSPGTAQIAVETEGAARHFLLVVAPTRPVVVDVLQPDWPASREAVLRGYKLDQLPFPAIQLDGEPVARAYRLDSTQIVIQPVPLNRGACSGPAVVPGVLSVVGGIVVGEPVVTRTGGPLLSLALGEAKRIDSNDACLRLLLAPDARLAVAGVDRSYLDQAREEAEVVRYAAHPFYTIFMADSTPAAGYSAARRREQPPFHDAIFDRPPDVVPYIPSAALATANVYANAQPYVVGDEFEWSTNNGRHGTYRVMGLYPPNVVLAVFKDDLPALWNDARKAAMDSLFMELGSSEVQGLYKNVFGPHPPATSAATGQMLVLFHDGTDSQGTGVNNPYYEDNRYSTIHFRRVHFQDDNGWYRNLVSHEFAHAWQFRNMQAFSAVWSIEGIANLFAEEFLRISVGLPLHANRDHDRQIRGWHFRLPVTGSFPGGYRESHPFLRFLVSRLVLVHGQSYESAVRRVVRGAALGWYGRHFVQWGSEEAVQGLGLVGRMQEVVPAWDPLEARLDWMLSFALDDRAPFDEYDIPFVRDAWQHFGPAQEIRLGDGEELSVTASRAGNLYYVLTGGAEPASVRLRIVSGEPKMAWKVVRFR